ncbi:MAG: hypothetical protein JSS85_05035 [Bacteroidetes bacterium]|nr:hypothetical protein [Bacteroidota bacterium]
MLADNKKTAVLNAAIKIWSRAFSPDSSGYHGEGYAQGACAGVATDSGTNADGT